MDYAHKSWWQIFEVIFGIPFLAGIILQLIVPLSLPLSFRMDGILFGVALFIVGVILVVFTRREFAHHKQPTDPGNPTSKIITTSVFSISRNPLYLGGIFAIAGIALFCNWPWVLLLLIPAIVACYYILIEPEEKYLASKFGNEYLLYTASVYRWIGRGKHNKK
jgi:protein-S-isoprenylcysteine O-methyltransferase Ste14